MLSSTVRCLNGLLLGGLLLTVTTLALSDSRVTAGSKAATLESCVVETGDIRRNHMDYLEHDRDSTVHQGLRNIKFSLKECINCHAEKDDNGGYKQINSEGQFCNVCHDYVAVSLDCFQCHRGIPEDKRPQIGLDSVEKSLAHPLFGAMSVASESSRLIQEGATGLHTTAGGD